MQEKQVINNNPIGIFDSGLGGLTVMSSISKLMSKENIIYFGDTAHVPYGTKSKETVTRFAIKISKFLIKNNVKIIVVACNTASAFSLDFLKRNMQVPVIGVIKAGAHEAIEQTKNKRIGIIGTQGTIKSYAYVKEIKKYDSKIKCFLQACPLFVPLVEEGWVENKNKKKIVEDIANIYLKNLIRRNIDALILGCTHYPLLKQTIQKVIGNKIKIVDSATAVAHEVKKVLEEKNLLNDKEGNKKYKFCVSDDPQKFETIGNRFVGKKIKISATKVEID